MARTASWLCLDFTGRCLATGLRFLPGERRFRAAQSAARALEPLARCIATPDHLGASADSAPEIALYLLLHAVTRSGVRFDPEVEIANYSVLHEAVREGRGVVLVAPHTMLMHLLYRRLHDDGLAPVGLSAAADEPLFGTTRHIPTLQPSSSVLLTARKLLRRGALICGMLDRVRKSAKAVELETRHGRVAFSPALLHLAARAGSRVLYCEVHVEAGRVHANIAGSTSTTGEGLTAEYLAFISAHMDRRAAREAPAL